MWVLLPERLDDDVVMLRPMMLDDAPAYAGAFHEDPSLGRLLGVETDPDEASVRERIERHSARGADTTFIQLAIADPVTDAFWGSVIVHSLSDHHRRAEVGFWVVPGERRRGVATHAVALVISWLFEVLALERVEMTTIPENHVVPGLAARLGFTQEGVLRSRDVERGRRVDIVWFGLLRREWRGS